MQHHHGGGGAAQATLNMHFCVLMGVCLLFVAAANKGVDRYNNGWFLSGWQKK